MTFFALRTGIAESFKRSARTVSDSALMRSSKSFAQ